MSDIKEFIPSIVVKLQAAKPSHSNVARVSSSITTIATQMEGGLPVIKLLQQGIDLLLTTTPVTGH